MTRARPRAPGILHNFASASGPETPSATMRISTLSFPPVFLLSLGDPVRRGALAQRPQKRRPSPQATGQGPPPPTHPQSTLERVQRAAAAGPASGQGTARTFARLPAAAAAASREATRSSPTAADYRAPAPLFGRPGESLLSLSRCPEEAAAHVQPPNGPRALAVEVERLFFSTPVPLVVSESRPRDGSRWWSGEGVDGERRAGSTESVAGA